MIIGQTFRRKQIYISNKQFQEQISANYWGKDVENVSRVSHEFGILVWLSPMQWT